jgi:PP-loop superfamily ATP-utilizing enzyme
MVERGEALVRGFGFRVFRVRHLVDAETGCLTARVLVAPDEMAALTPVKTEMGAGLLELGYHAVEFDPSGYRSPS